LHHPKQTYHWSEALLLTMYYGQVLLVVWIAFSRELASAFLHVTAANNRITAGILLENNSDDEIQKQEGEVIDAGKDGSKKDTFNWLEEWALEGAEKIGLLGIQERTQRVMLAQMAEDQIYENSKILETFVDQKTGEIEQKNKETARELANMNRNLQKEYRNLVSGEPSALLSAISNSEHDNDGVGEQ